MGIHTLEVLIPIQSIKETGASLNRTANTQINLSTANDQINLKTTGADVNVQTDMVYVDGTEEPPHKPIRACN